MAERERSTTQAVDGGLFQSLEWAELQTLASHRAQSFQVGDMGGVVITEKLSGIGAYLYVPRGPVIADESDAAAVVTELLSLAEQEKAGWIRIEPQTETALIHLREVVGEKRFVRAPKDINPREILMVSLAGTDATWLAQMKPKTRYNIRLAEKSGVTVRFSRTSADMQKLIALVQTTSKRKGIFPHVAEYYKQFLLAFPGEQATLAVAEKDGRTLAVGLLVFYNMTAYYLHGGSSEIERSLMAPFLLHFESMREAKRRGCTRYDFGGVRLRSKVDAADTDWDGITRFKQGFSPDTETLLFPGSYDIIVSLSRYTLYRCLRRLQVARTLFRRYLLR